MGPLFHTVLIDSHRALCILHLQPRSCFFVLFLVLGLLLLLLLPLLLFLFSSSIIVVFVTQLVLQSDTIISKLPLSANCGLSILLKEPALHDIALTLATTTTTTY